MQLTAGNSPNLDVRDCTKARQDSRHDSEHAYARDDSKSTVCCLQPWLRTGGTQFNALWSFTTTSRVARLYFFRCWRYKSNEVCVWQRTSIYSPCGACKQVWIASNFDTISRNQAFKTSTNYSISTLDHTDSYFMHRTQWPLLNCLFYRCLPKNPPWQLAHILHPWSIRH